MSASLITSLDGQYFDANGEPLALGTLTFYAAGTSSLKTVYSSYDAGSTLVNPVALDSAGRAQVWGVGLYKVVAKNEAGAVQWTRDYVFANGAEASVIGNFTVDHTTATQPYPVVFEHSNIFSNTDTYGSGTVTIKATGQNNNQPLLYVSKIVDTANNGNAANLILANSGGSTKTIASIFAVDCELVANNSLIDSVNGKFELGAISGYSSGAGEAGGGLFYIAPRRKTATGFERMVDMFQLSRGGRIYHRGEGISITPLYDPADSTNVSWSNNRAFLDITTAFTDTEINAETTKVGGNVRITYTSEATGYVRNEMFGGTDSYSRVASTSGAATVYAEARSANKNATLELRSNWVTPGTGNSIINLYRDNSGSIDGHRIQANGTNGRLNIRAIVAGTTYEGVDIDPVQDGLVTIYRNSDYTKGRLKLSSGGGAAGGGIIEYDSNTGELSIDADTITVGGNQIAQYSHQLTATSSGGSSNITPTALDHSFICNTGALMATYTFVFPNTPADNQVVRVLNRAGVTAATFTPSGGATIYNAPAALAAGTPYAWLYIASANVWYRIV